MRCLSLLHIRSKAALAENHDVIPIYITKEGIWLTGDELGELSTFTDGSLPRANDYDSITVEFQANPRFSVLPKRSGIF